MIDLGIALALLPHHPVAVRRAAVDASGWRSAAERTRAAGGRLVALWGSHDDEQPPVVEALFALGAQLVWLETSAAHGYPAIDDLYPAAGRMQRAAADLAGVRANGAGDERPWLRHCRWDGLPLATAAPVSGTDEPYDFVQVAGDGVHEIPVGPVHAGTIEPGHFRFSVVGEAVLRLEQRLGYTHKGIERLFRHAELDRAARLAGRVSGDSTVAYAWAFAQAIEALCATTVPARATWLRALLLERERVANHLGDLGYLGSDAGLAFGLAQFSRLKEDWIRAQAQLFGHRYMMDRIVPGGVDCDLDGNAAQRMRVECAELARAVTELEDIYADHAGVQDRFVGCGRVDRALAQRLDLTGVAARASGIALDARSSARHAPYDRIDVPPATATEGDVAARVAVRFREVHTSLTAIATILDVLPAGELRVALPGPAGGRHAVGWIEGWRGEIAVAVRTDAEGRIARVHPHDPSWQNWPALEHAVIGNIVADFPLINKSFNLSYSGVDL